MENGGKRMMGEDGMVWYGCTSTCRQVQVVSELGTESSPTRSYQGKGKGQLRNRN